MTNTSIVCPSLKARWLADDHSSTYISCSHRVLYRLVQRGDLVPDGRVGRRLRFSRQVGDLVMIGPVNRGFYPLLVARRPRA